MKFKLHNWKVISAKPFSIDYRREKEMHTKRNRELILFHGRNSGGEASCNVPSKLSVSTPTIRPTFTLRLVTAKPLILAL
jgi:hypothetical protein